MSLQFTGQNQKAVPVSYHNPLPVSIASGTPPVPKDTTAVIKEYDSALTTQDVQAYVIPNDTVLVINRLVGGAVKPVDGDAGKVYLVYDPDGTGSPTGANTVKITPTVYCMGMESEGLSFMTGAGDGTRQILLVRDKVTADSLPIYIAMYGYLKSV